MSIDYLATLRPESGIARAASLIRPDSDRNPLWTLAVDIGQDEIADRSASDDEFTLSLVGAADVRRSQVYARAAGEAVERWALKPSDAIPRESGPTFAPGALWRSSAVDVDGYAARWIEGDPGEPDRVVVPTAAVDYPAGAGDDWDPSPSGAAAGVGLADATERACRELLERDAAMRAWYAADSPELLDEDAAVRAEPDFARLVALSDSLGLRRAVVRLPAVSAEVRPMMAMLIDPRHRVAAAGLALGHRDAASAARALQEAFQVRTVLTRRPPEERTSPPGIVSDDAGRARYWSSEVGVAAAGQWMDALRSPQQTLRDDPAVPWSAFVGPHAVVDLTPRLPVPIRDMGWAAVKVLAPELQPLRMSDGVTWNLRRDVAAKAVAPHPFV